MTDEGQITIPADVRQRLNLKPGRKLFLQMSDGDNLDTEFGYTKAPYVGARAMRGYGKSINNDCRTTEEIMKELREGEME